MKKFSDFLNESRTDNPNFEFKEIVKNSKTLGNVIDRVVLEVKGNSNVQYGKWGSEYMELKEKYETLGEELKSMNEEIKGSLDILFDANDQIYTRVVNTSECIFTFSKKTTEEKTVTDYEAIVKKIESILTEQVDAVDFTLETLLKIKAEFSSKSVSTKSPGLSIKGNVKESLLTDFISSVKKTASNVWNWIKSKFSKIDKGNKELSDMIAKI